MVTRTWFWENASNPEKTVIVRADDNPLAEIFKMRQCMTPAPTHFEITPLQHRIFDWYDENKHEVVLNTERFLSGL